MSKNLILIDLSAIYWAAWHATADKEVSAAFESTVAKVHSMRDGYDLCAVCCDAPPYKRKELLPTYKAQRDAPPPLALEQFRRVKERLESDGLLLWSSPGYEADDVIATATKHAVAEGLAVTIASGDKDLMQLVDDAKGVRVWSPMSGVKYTRDQVIMKFGVAPEMMNDFLALTGDTSDNVPGIPGVGPKTAAKLLMEHGSMDAACGACMTFTPKMQAAFLEHADAARLARKLVALCADVPINWPEIHQERKTKPLADTDAEMNEIEEPAAETPPPTVAKAADMPAVTAIVSRPAEWSLALEPNTAKAAWAVAGALLESRLYQQLGSQAAIYAVLLRGRSLGLDATTSLAAFHNIKGKLTMHADLIEALVLRSGKAEYFDIVETTSERATYATKRVGARREVAITFTIQDALDAGLVEKHPEGRDGYRGISESGKPSNWDKYRATMLRMRAKTQLCRAVYPDVVLGLYSADEASDGTTEPMDAAFEAA